MSGEIETQTRYWNDEAQAFQQIYSREKPALSNLLDSVFRRDMFQRFAFTMERSEPINGRSILDVGCGSGLYAVEFAKRGARHVTGLDIAENMLEMCRRAAETEHVADRCSFLHSDLLALTGGDKFDVTIGIGLFDYIRDASPVLKRMHEVTADRVIVSFPRLWTWRAPVRKMRLALRGCPVYFYSHTSISRLMRDAGFPRSDIVKVGKLYCVVGHVAG